MAAFGQRIEHSEGAKTWWRWLLDTDKFQSEFPDRRVVDASAIVSILGQSAERFILRHLDQVPVARLCKIINTSSTLIRMEVKQRLKLHFEENSFQPYNSPEENIVAAQKLLNILKQEATAYITSQLPPASILTLCELVTEDKDLSEPAQKELNRRLKRNTEILFETDISQSEIVINIYRASFKMAKPKYSQRFVKKYLHLIDVNYLRFISRQEFDPFARQAKSLMNEKMPSWTRSKITSLRNNFIEKNDFRHQ